MDQYVPWSLPSDELTLDTIWVSLKNFSSPNQIRCEPTLTFSQASGKVTEVCMNGIMQGKHKSIWLKKTQKLPRSFTETFSGFTCRMRSLHIEPSVMEV